MHLWRETDKEGIHVHDYMYMTIWMYGLYDTNYVYTCTCTFIASKLPIKLWLLGNYQQIYVLYYEAIDYHGNKLPTQ